MRLRPSTKSRDRSVSNDDEVESPLPSGQKQERSLEKGTPDSISSAVKSPAPFTSKLGTYLVGTWCATPPVHSRKNACRHTSLLLPHPAPRNAEVPADRIILVLADFGTMRWAFIRRHVDTFRCVRDRLWVGDKSYPYTDHGII